VNLGTVSAGGPTWGGINGCSMDGGPTGHTPMRDKGPDLGNLDFGSLSEWDQAATQGEGQHRGDTPRGQEVHSRANPRLAHRTGVEVHT